jgi:hypothetical protein
VQVIEKVGQLYELTSLSSIFALALSKLHDREVSGMMTERFSDLFKKSIASTEVL